VSIAAVTGPFTFRETVTTMAEAMLWGLVLRLTQAALQAAPFIFTGLCIAGILHRLMGQQYTRWLFGSNSLASLAQSWFLGMLLPGCSLGTIPIVRQLRVSAISVGTIFAFALSSPLFDPLSLLYGLTLSKPLTILAFAFCSLIVVTLSGSIFDALFTNTEVDSPEPPPTPYGIKRLLAVLVVMAREIVSVSGVYIVIGLLGTGLLSLLLPPGSLQRTMSHDNPWSPLMMTGIAVPAYATPMMAMGQLGSMFQHGNSVGAAFILLVFGAGMNLGLLAWMARNYGLKKSGVWVAIMLLVVVEGHRAGRPHACCRHVLPTVQSWLSTNRRVCRGDLAKNPPRDAAARSCRRPDGFRTRRAGTRAEMA
jgi:uncharacterized protein